MPLSPPTVSAFLSGKEFELLISLWRLTVCLSYLMIVKSLMPGVVAALHRELGSPNTRLPDWILSSRIWLCLIMLILAPLSFLRHLDSFRHVSFIAIFATGKEVCSPLRGDRADEYLNQHTLLFL